MATTLAPAVRQSLKSQGAPQRSLIDSIEINHGPVGMLGRFFLLADQLITDVGITINRASLADLAGLQSAHKSSWALFPPMLDVRLSAIPEDMSYALVGRNAAGDIVCAQGGRIYSTGDRSLADIVQDQSFFYATGSIPLLNAPRIALSAPSASAVVASIPIPGIIPGHPLPATVREPRLSQSMQRIVLYKEYAMRLIPPMRA